MERALRELEGPEQLLHPFKGEHLNGREQASRHISPPRVGPRFPNMVGCKHQVHLDMSTIIGWIIGSKVHRNSVARKVTHQSTILILGGLTSEFLC